MNKIQYKCSNCDYTSSKYFGLCPQCKNGEGIEDTQEDKKESSKSAYSQNSFVYDKNIINKINKVDETAPEMKAYRSTGYKNLDPIISSSNGFIEGQVILLGADPGTGKSTLCAAIGSEDTLYISSEENYDQVNSRVLRITKNSKNKNSNPYTGNNSRGMKILNTTNINEVLSAIRYSESKIIVIDSLNSIEFGVGYSTTARFAAEITEVAKQENKICIIISQVSRSGEITGMNSIVHVVDTVLYLEKSQTSQNIIAVSTKNRFGEVGEIDVFVHKEDGLEEININDYGEVEELSPGVTFTETKFGRRNITISIESLVVDSQTSFGLRKANGYNPNRLIQLVGILSYFGKINLTNKDIYINISNGLYTDNVAIELAIANSILSSYYNKALIDFAYGEVRLNGSIINGECNIINKKGNSEKIQIKHINELIKMYKGGQK